MRIPQKWLDLHPHDTIHTTSPYWRLEKYAETLGPLGYSFRFEPSGNGYRVICLESPLAPVKGMRH